MNELKKQILNIIQTQFPIEQCPFASLADQLDSSEAEIIDEVNQLKENGVVRRIGAIFDAAHLGYVSTLVAAQVPIEKVDAFVDDVNTLPGVSHNYGRAHKYNIWFTLTMPGNEVIDRTIKQLRDKYETPNIYSLPAEKLYKIKVDFNFGDQPQKQAASHCNTQVRQVATSDFSDWQIALIRQLQEDLAVTSEPFNAIAQAVDKDIDVVLGQIRDWKDAGLIRRFGSSIRHHKAGFTANGMAVFQVEPEQLDEAGHLLGQYSQVSHCYHRPTAPDWPYNLFAMTHCQSQEQLTDLVNKMVEQIKPKQHDVLLSTKEYKKTNVKYFVE